MAERAYGHCSFDHQYFMGVFTAFAIYADDFADPEAVAHFSRNLAMGIPQLDPVLDRYADHIRTAYDLYPLISANAVISRTCQFMDATYMEGHTKGMRIHPDAARYPWYLRGQAGVAVPYAVCIFPKEVSEDAKPHYQAISDIDSFICLTNDVMSFYKENGAGETCTYVQNRAVTTNKSAPEVFRDLVNDVIDTAARIDRVLSFDRTLYESWRAFLVGYVEFHLRSKRYRLHELGFDGNYRALPPCS